MDATDPGFWASLCGRVQRRHPDLYRSWMPDVPLIGVRGGVMLAQVADPVRAGYLRTACAEAFAEAAAALSGRLLTLSVVEAPAGHGAPAQRVLASGAAAALSADFTFELFVVGPSNRLAHAACQAVVADPGGVYNPLFIHGPSGLGKSHLVQATCGAAARLRPQATVRYVSCETLINEFIRALADRAIDDFRSLYRNVDLLAVDDVQCLAGQESAQEEFFHTFNALYHNRRQIVLSSDVPPAEIPTLEERLVSRFNWGLVALIESPDQATRRAILESKVRLHGYEVESELLDLIAESVSSNVRALEGALNQLVAQARLAGQPPSRELLMRTLAQMGAQPMRRLQISDIIEMVANYYGIRRAELVGKRRSRSVVGPRHVGMYLARRLTPCSLEEIGGQFGGRDHSTVLHAERAVSDLLKSQDRATEEALAILTRRLMARR